MKKTVFFSALSWLSVICVGRIALNVRLIWAKQVLKMCSQIIYN
jgi:hypothetical protein